MVNHRPPKRIDLGFDADVPAAAERKPSKRPRLQDTKPAAAKIAVLGTGKSKAVAKVAHGRARGEQADEGATMTASKKRREKKKAAKKARVEAKASGEAPPKPTNVGVLYLREWATKDDDGSTWKFQKVRQTWLLKNMFNPASVEKGDFKILLKYLKGLQGKSRGETVAAAQEHVNELADVGEGAEDAFNRIKKKRSEKIIKMFG
eukprot:gene310-26320_t